jgi:DNA-binding MltR family transcriptional regulator
MLRKEKYVKKPTDYIIGYQHIEKLLAQESSRACVIIFAAKIEELLEKILRKYLVSATTKVDDLLDGDAPLATFSAKIRVAYRIGLIDITFVRALDLIRKTRNAFAHDIEDCTLTDEPHKSRVRELAELLRKSPAFPLWKKTFFANRPDGESDFFASTAYVLLRLDKIYLAIDPLDADKSYVLLPDEFLCDESEA